MKRFKRFVCGVLSLGFLGVLGFLCFLPMGCVSVFYVDYSTRVFCNSMGFDISMIGKNSEKAYEKMIDELELLNQQININVLNANPMQNNSQSDILKLNLASKSQQIEIGYHAYYLLTKAKEIYSITPAFNMAIYPLTYLWGVDPLSLNYYNSNIDETKAPIPPSFINSKIRSKYKPTKQQINEILPYCNLDFLNLYTLNGKYYASKQIDELMIDLGAIAKGYAVDLCVQICKEYDIQSAFINIAGNLYAYGKYFNKSYQDYWKIKLLSPNNNEILCEFRVDNNLSVVTSGDYHRYRVFINDVNDVNDVISIQNAQELMRYACHIINPKNGIPYSLNYIENELNDLDEWDYVNNTSHITSATIILNNSMLADSFSTAICVLGMEEGSQLIKTYNDNNENKIQALLFSKDLKFKNIDVTLTNTQEFNAYQQYLEI